MPEIRRPSLSLGCLGVGGDVWGRGMLAGPSPLPWGTEMSSGANHYGCTTTIAGRRLRRMSLTKERTFPSSEVGCGKDGVMN